MEPSAILSVSPTNLLTSLLTYPSLFLAFLTYPTLLHALPQSPEVAHGQATLTEAPTTLTIHQSTQNAILNWQSFNIGTGETVTFQQPSTNSISLNRVLGGGASHILGTLNSNGAVWLLNPQGVMFGAGAQVNVGSLLATTANLTDDNFLSQNYTFTNAQNTVSNHGTLTITPQGYAILAAPTVENAGTIQTPQGTTHLAGAEAFTIDPTGDNLLTLSPNPSTFALHVANSGHITAHGGTVALTTQLTNAALASTVNTTGLIEATSFESKGGTITLGTDTTRLTQVSGKVEANGPTGGGDVQILGQFVDVKTGAKITTNATETGNGGTIYLMSDRATRFAGEAQSRGGPQGGNGGFIEISGRQNLAFSGHADTLAPQGKVGTLLFDPTNITITDGGPDTDDAQVADFQILEADGGATPFSISEDALEALAAGTDIILEATNNITIADLTDNELTLATTGNVTFTADSDTDGSGDFSMNIGDTITTAGATFTATGANIQVGTIETNAASGGAVNLNANAGAGTVTVGGNILTDNGAITLTGATALAANVTLSNGGGSQNITLTGAVSGASEQLSFAAGTGDITMGGAVTLDTLVFSSGDALTLGGAWAVAGNIDFTSLAALTLSINTTLNADGGAGNITFDSGNTINGARQLTLTGTDITLPTIGNLTPLTTLTTNAGGTLSLASTATTNDQTYNATAINLDGTLTSSAGSVLLNDPTTLTGDSTVNASSFVAASTINGAQSLNLTTTGAADFQGIVGGITPLTAFTASGGTLNTVGVRTSGNQAHTGAGNIGGTYTSTAGSMAFNSAATLATTLNLNTTNNDITFASTINGGSPIVAATGTGTLNFNGIVGGSTPVAAITNTGDTAITANVTTSANQTYNTLSLGAALTTTGGVFSIGDTTLTAHSTLTTAGGNITLTGTTNGAFNLTLNPTTGDISIGDDVSIATLIFTAADDLTLAGNLTTTSALNTTTIDDITLTADSTWNLGTSTLTMAAGNTVTGAFDLAIAGGTLTLGTVNGVDDLTLTASTANNVANTVSTDGTQTYNGPTNLGTTLTTTGDAVTLAGATTLTANSTINTANGALSLNTLDGAFNFTTDTGNANITLANTIGGSTPVDDLTFTTTGDFASTGDITQNGDLTITAANIAFANPITGDNITLNGDTTIDQTLTALTNLAITGDTLLGADLVVGGNITINGNTTLSTNATMATGGGALNTLTHNGNINGDFNLTLVAGVGDITMAGDIDINALTITSGNNFIFNGGTIEADNGLDFSPVSQIMLGGDTEIYGRDGSTRADVAMGTANTILATTTGIDLLLFGDLVTLYQVGDDGSGNLETLTVDANTASILGNIYTTGAQTITALEGLAGFLSSGGGDISLNTAATLVGNIFITTSGGNIYINQPLNGAYEMDLNAGLGEVHINAALGNTTPLTNMTILADIINLNSPITTTGNQTYTGETNLNSLLTIGLGDITYNSPVNLGGNGAIDTTGGNGDITFNDTVNGPQNLTLRAGDGGDILFNGPVGAETRLGDITVESTRNITFTYGVYLENYIQNRIDGLASFGFSPGLNATGSVQVATSNNLNGRFTGRDISLEAVGLVSGEVYATNSLNLTSGQTLLNGSIAGDVGRAAARRITFNGFNDGPHYFASMNLPLTEQFVASSNDMRGAPLATTLILPTTSLNPFQTLPTYLLADAGTVEDEDPATILTPWLEGL